MNPTKIKIDILTIADGTFSQDITPHSGAVLQYRYVPHATNNLDGTADLTITGKDSGLVVVNQLNFGTSAFTRSPRQPTHAMDGTASLFAVGGEPVEGFVYIAGESLTISIAHGGDAKQGTLHLWIGET